MSVSVTATMIADDLRKFTAKAPASINKGTLDGIRRVLALMSRHHVRNEWIRSARGGRLSSGPDRQEPHDTKLTARTGNLLRSYQTRIIESELLGGYGSDSVYAPVHEFGSPAKNIKARPGVQRTLTAVEADIQRILGDSVETSLERAT